MNTAWGMARKAGCNQTVRTIRTRDVQVALPHGCENAESFQYGVYGIQ